MTLASYAISEDNSLGRQHAIPEASDRNAYARDYSRVLHSKAFRRLQHKTQVFSSTTGDEFRTRMSHSLEVEQISRSVARQLSLNEDLCAVLAIGHDLGHAPFGHMGQDTLENLLFEHGGFEHNLQSLRIVDELESPYVEHKGLNLMFETREGLLKHCTKDRAEKLGPVAERHLKNRSASLEAQVVDFADAIAYTHADLEDAFTFKLIMPQDMKKVPGFIEAAHRLQEENPNFKIPSLGQFKHEESDVRRKANASVQAIIREMMRATIEDLVAQSKKNLKIHAPQSPDEARDAGELIAFSPAQRKKHYDLKRFSRETIYAHPQVVKVRDHEQKCLTALFHLYEQHPQEMTGFALDKKANLYDELSNYLSSLTDYSVHRKVEQYKVKYPEIFDRVFKTEANIPHIRPQNLQMA